MVAGKQGCKGLQKSLVFHPNIRHHGVMSESNEHLARILSQQLAAMGLSDAASGELFGVNWKTIFNWRNAKSAPTTATRAATEKGLGWKPGSIDRLLSGEGAFLSLADVQDLPAEERPVKRASDLTDDELAMEMMRRFRNYADVAHNIPASVPEPMRRLDYGLAASHDASETKN